MAQSVRLLVSVQVHDLMDHETETHVRPFISVPPPANVVSLKETNKIFFKNGGGRESKLLKKKDSYSQKIENINK